MTHNAVIMIGHGGIGPGLEFLKIIDEERKLAEKTETQFVDTFFHELDSKEATNEGIAELGGTVVPRAVVFDASHQTRVKLKKQIRDQQIPYVRIRDLGLLTRGSENQWWLGYRIAALQFGPWLENALGSGPSGWENVQNFHIFHSTGGGTGSGASSYVAEKIRELRPESRILCYSVLPSAYDDVHGAPPLAHYNTILSLSTLTGRQRPEFLPDFLRTATTSKKAADQVELPKVGKRRPADLIFVFQNEALAGVNSLVTRKVSDNLGELNTMIGRYASHVTSCARFPGPPGFDDERDIGDIVTCLLRKPQPFVMAAAAPIVPEYEKTDDSSVTELVEYALSSIYSLSGRALSPGEVDSLYVGARGDVTRDEMGVVVADARSHLGVGKEVKVPFNGCVQPSPGATRELWLAANCRSIGHLLGELTEEAQKEYVAGDHSDLVTVAMEWKELDSVLTTFQGFATSIQRGELGRRRS
ncbi:MAG TPA: tubulin-like doman-containing protein [Candidatus Thermoplasmatota archaeon]|nr:tubulin-like doman-containing protein [Candidatus Thermoplasmatota archaeon]